MVCARVIFGGTDAARSVREDILVICHSGPIDELENVQKAMDMMPGINGFFGVTSMERLPVERAIKEQVAKFKGLKLST